MKKFKITRIATAYITYEKVIEAENEDDAMDIADEQMEHMHNWEVDDIIDWHDYEVTEQD